MSNFISCIFDAGLIEMPPVSKVTALPTKPRCGPVAAARVAQHDQARLGVGALRHRGEGAHAAGQDGVAVEQLDLERSCCGGDLGGALGQEGGRGHVRGQVLQVARPVGGRRRRRGRARRRPRRPTRRPPRATRCRRRRRPSSLVLLRLEAVELVEAQQRALDDRPRVPSGASHDSETAPSSAARPAAADAATRTFSASSSSRLPSPAISTRRRPPPGASSWATATFLSPALASPSSTSAWSAGSASESPSNRPTTRVSAAVSSGAPRRAVTLISRMSGAV